MNNRLYQSIIPCFGSRFSVLLAPEAKQYNVYPLGSFHFFDWQKPDSVGITLGTCPQIISSTTARIGVRVGDQERIFPFGPGELLPQCEQLITPLTTQLAAGDQQLGIEVRLTLRSLFYPQDMEASCAPCYRIELAARSERPMVANLFVALPLANGTRRGDAWHSVERLIFPERIDHEGIDGLSFEQVLAGDGVSAVARDGYGELGRAVMLTPDEWQTVTFFHAGYIAQPTLNTRGKLRRFGYTDYWEDAADVVDWMQANREEIDRRSALFESSVNDAWLSPAIKLLMASAFKGVASNAWYASDGWFSVMEIGAYHATLDVDYQLALFFFQYWPQLIATMLRQWAAFYTEGSGYMAHDVGQHLEATGNRYGGPQSAMKVEENCNFVLLLHHYWRSTGDAELVTELASIVGELVDFLEAADSNGSGLPNRFCDNTNDWGSRLITSSEEQSYHGVRLVAAYSAVAQMGTYRGDEKLATRCRRLAQRVGATLEASWLGDHYPISLAEKESWSAYSMWTTHGLLYPLRSRLGLPLDLQRLSIDLVSSTTHTMREHGSVHSSADVRGWLTQNLWRDAIAGYLGFDFSAHARRYLGHGEYVSYEDTTILEVANELMVVDGAVRDHDYGDRQHETPMVDGHPRPACIFGLPYALAGLQLDEVAGKIWLNPVSFPLRIALTHLADWEREELPWLVVRRSIPNQDRGYAPTTISYRIEGRSERLAAVEITAGNGVVREQ